MRFLLAFLLLLPVAASAQQNQCRTSPVGTSTAYCASEAFVTDSAATAGNVSGPATSTTNAIPRWKDATGKSLLDSSVLIDGSNNISGAASFTTSGAISGSSVAGALVATKAQQQAGSLASVVVTPLHQQDHDSAEKAHVYFTAATAAILESYNVSGVTRSAAGSYTASFTVPFASANYTCHVSTVNSGNNTYGEFNSSAIAAGSIGIFTLNNFTGTTVDPVAVMLTCSGRQ